jgi:tetratricopeptide (TPR) repeat protein
MTMHLRTIVLLLLFFGSMAGAFAQKSEHQLAYERYEAGDLSGARTHIGTAIADPKLAQDPGVWLLRGFIYKDLFKQETVVDSADAHRDLALSSLATCMARDTAGIYVRDARQAFEYLAKTYYNDAAVALNASDPDRATQLFAKYKETMARIDPAFDPRMREVEFLNALGTVYTKQYNQDRLDTIWFDKAVRTYMAVLVIDRENYGANYNLATLYYNRGVYNIQRITPENSIPDIQDIQTASRDLFAKALPYMLKAHEMNPERKETLLGLEGIYYSLQDNEESEKFRRMYEALEPQEEH